MSSDATLVFVIRQNFPGARRSIQCMRLGYGVLPQCFVYKLAAGSFHFDGMAKSLHGINAKCTRLIFKAEINSPKTVDKLNEAIHNNIFRKIVNP